MRTRSLLRAKLEGTTILGGGLKTLRERDQLWVLPIAAVGILVAVAGLVFLLYQNYRAMAALGAAYGHADFAATLGVITSWAVVFILGFPIAASVLYLSRDTRMLAALPIPAWQIVAANVGLLYLYALPVALLFFLPAIVAGQGVAVTAGAGIVGYWLSGIVVALLIPVVPLTLSVLVMTLVTRVVNLSRFRTGLEAVGMLLVVVVLVGVQVLLSRTFSENGNEVAITDAMGGLILGIRGALPPALWYARAMLPGGVALLAGSILGSMAVGALAIAAVQSGYLRQLANQAVTRTRRRGAAPSTLPRAHGPVASLVIREVKLLTSNSTFLFESVGELFVFPIILLLLRLTVPGEMMAEMMPFLDRTDLVLPIVTGALVLFAGLNSVSSAALSREGRSFDLSLSLPQPGSVQVRAKIVTYVVLFGGAFLINSALVTWILRRAWWYIPAIAATGIPFIWLIGVTTISADIRRPHLTWNHPQQAVKQNVNVIIGMGIAVVVVAFAGAPAIVAALRGAAPLVIQVLAAGFAFVAAAVIARLVRGYADRRYAGAFSR